MSYTQCILGKMFVLTFVRYIPLSLFLILNFERQHRGVGFYSNMLVTREKECSYESSLFLVTNQHVK